jgi:hypothetical protein
LLRALEEYGQAVTLRVLQRVRLMTGAGESSVRMRVAELASHAIRRLFGLERESAIKFPVGAVEQH